MTPYFDCKLQRWGYMDHHGNPVVEPQFLEALPFREGRAAVLVETDFLFLFYYYPAYYLKY